MIESSNPTCTSNTPLATPKRQTHDRHDSAIAVTPVSNKATTSTSSSTSTFSLTRPIAPTPTPLLQRVLRRNKLTLHHTPTLNALIHGSSQDLCSNILRRAIPSSGLNLLITDPLVVDFLLVCIATNSGNHKVGRRDLVPGCPVLPNLIDQCMHYVPRLSSINTSSDLFKALTRRVQDTNSSIPSTVTPLQSGLLLQQLLAWLLTTSSFTNIRSLFPPSPHPFLSPHHPILPFSYLRSLNILPFLVTSQPPQKEALFAAHCADTAPDLPVTLWHGTHLSRVPLILSQGLRNMSNSKFQTNGRCMGEGIYLSTEFSTSFMYSTVSTPWNNSAFKDWETGVLGLPPETEEQSSIPVPCAESGDYAFWSVDDCYGSSTNPGGVRVILGCEVAAGKAGRDDVIRCEGVQGRFGQGKKKGMMKRDAGFVEGVKKTGGIYVITDASRVVVRFVFLVPTGAKVYKSPAADDALAELEQMTANLRSMRGC